MGNFAENPNQGKRVLPPPPAQSLSDEMQSEVYLYFDKFRQTLGSKTELNFSNHKPNPIACACIIKPTLIPNPYLIKGDRNLTFEKNKRFLSH